MEALQGEIAGF